MQKYVASPLSCVTSGLLGTSAPYPTSYSNMVIGIEYMNQAQTLTWFQSGSEALGKSVPSLGSAGTLHLHPSLLCGCGHDTHPL